MPSRDSIKFNYKTPTQITREQNNRKKERRRVLRMMTSNFFKNKNERLEDAKQ
jgi:hypothetical protein